MPRPTKGEEKSHYISRCIKEVMGEGADRNAAVGKCEGMYRTYKKSLEDRDRRLLKSGILQLAVLVKGRKGLPVGTIKEYNGMKFQKTPQGWKYVGGGGAASGGTRPYHSKKREAQKHGIKEKDLVTIHDKKGNEFYVHNPPTNKKGREAISRQEAAHAAMQDTAKNRMRKEGRTKMSREDYNAGVKEYNRVNPASASKREAKNVYKKFKASGLVLDFINKRHAGLIKEAKRAHAQIKKLIPDDEQRRSFLTKFGDPDKPGNHEDVRDKWIAEIERIRSGR